MNGIRKHLVAATLLAAFGAAVAQAPQSPVAPQGGPEAHMRGGHHGKRLDPAQRAERMAKRQAALKQKLQITPAQEGAWNTWTQAMKPPANLQRPNREEFARLTTPERIDRMRALRTQRAAEFDRRAEATKAFYAQLSPEQKKAFDERGMRRGGQGRHGHRG